MRHVRGTLFSIAAVALVTGAVYALRPVAPVLSLGALYVFAVLPVAVLWGLAYAIAVAVGASSSSTSSSCRRCTPSRCATARTGSRSPSTS